MAQDQIIAQILEEVREIRVDLKRADAKLDQHMVDEEKLLIQHTADIASIRAGFPNGDPFTHNAFHTSIIRRNEFLADVFKEAAKHIAKYGLFAFVVWLLWHGITDLVHSVTHK